MQRRSFRLLRDPNHERCGHPRRTRLRRQLGRGLRLPGASNTTDINDAVRDEAALVADIYTSDSGHVPTVQLSPPRQLTVGGAPAVQIVASVTNIATSNCVGPTAIHSMVATTVPGQQGCVLFVISLRRAFPTRSVPPSSPRWSRRCAGRAERCAHRPPAVWKSYADSACCASSMPSTSCWRSARRPIVYLSARPMIPVTTTA